MLLLLALGCQGDCDATRTPGPTLHQVALRIPHPAGGATLDLTLDGAPAGSHAMIRDGDDLTITLNGLPPLSEARYSLIPDSGRRCVGAFTTDNLPPQLPELSVTRADNAAMDDAVLLLGTLMGATSAVFIIDRQGRFRWHRIIDDDALTSDAHLVSGTILYNRYDQERIEDIGAVAATTLLGEPGEEIRTEWGHHVFAPLADGGLAWPALDIRAWSDPDSGETLDVVGDRILTTDGEVFSIWDAAEPELDTGTDQGFYELGYDWSHANALQAINGGFLLSLGHLDAVYDVTAAGAVAATYRPDDVIDGTPWHFQHDANLTPDGTLLLVSHEPDATVAREYAIGDDGLTEVWSVAGPLSGFLGQARRLDNGNTLVGFGGKGLLREVTPDGEIAWQLEAGLGSWFGNVTLLDDVLGTAVD
ncbi:MAG: hypothetical protein P8R54_07405 [Myxococcota bacterium]|nr:hypothetical protein [Myxococcota bacterium]